MSIEIPNGVYYAPEHANFYDMKTHGGMGLEFWERWKFYRSIFPRVENTPSVKRVRLRKYIEPNGRGDFMFLREDRDHKPHGFTPVNEWMEIEVTE